MAGDDESLPATLRAALLEVAAIERRRSVRLTRIDGEPAGSSDLAQPLLDLGAERDGPGLRVGR
jgi:hypothetical protein